MLLKYSVLCNLKASRIRRLILFLSTARLKCFLLTETPVLNITLSSNSVERYTKRKGKELTDWPCENKASISFLLFNLSFLLKENFNRTIFNSKVVKYKSSF